MLNLLSHPRAPKLKILNMPPFLLTPESHLLVMTEKNVKCVPLRKTQCRKSKTYKNKLNMNMSSSKYNWSLENVDVRGEMHKIYTKLINEAYLQHKSITEHQTSLILRFLILFWLTDV